jgi:predicted ATPase
LDWAECWISLGQGSEVAYRALMAAYDALGDHSKVALTYERCVQALRALDLGPSEQTRALAFKKASSLHIPFPLTSFIGREKEMKEIVGLLSKSRLVTLTGSGGVGKTRVSIQVAAEVQNKFPDGVWFLDLAPLSDAALVPGTLANLLGLRESGDAGLSVTDLLVNYFCCRTALVIFDNCEHLIALCAHLVNSLLTSCENLSILATSREALRVSGEIRYRVPSLEIPRPDIESAIDALAKVESVRLFRERAEFVSSGSAMSPQNAFVIAQICRRLDGIPLAIELAAARANVLTVEQIFERLDDRFNLLGVGLRTALPRHQTLRATIEWSYDLLSVAEQTLFRRLSVFVGGFTHDAAENVAVGDIISKFEIAELLGRLINKSLVIVDDRAGNAGREQRYAMLETIREYAGEKLRAAGERDRVCHSHLEFFVNLAERAGLSYLQDQLESETGNLRSALDRAFGSHEIIHALKLFSVLGELRRFWTTRAHYHDGVERLKTILSHSDASQSTPARLKALNTFFHMLWQSGALRDVQPLMEEALELGMQLGDHRDTAFTLTYLGLCATATGDYPLARSYLEQSLEMWRELQDIKYMGWSFSFLGDVAMFQDDTDRAQALYVRAIPLLKKAKDPIFLALPIRRLGQLEMRQGRLLKATAHL